MAWYLGLRIVALVGEGGIFSLDLTGNESRACNNSPLSVVIPANAGIAGRQGPRRLPPVQARGRLWTLAFAGGDDNPHALEPRSHARQESNVAPVRRRHLLLLNSGEQPRSAAVFGVISPLAWPKSEDFRGDDRARRCFFAGLTAISATAAQY